MGLKGWIWTAGVVLLVAMLAASRDDPPPNDASLMPASVDVADADNAYPVFLKMQAALPLSDAERIAISHVYDGTASAEQQAAADALVARSTEAAALFAEFSRRAAFQDPHYRDLAAVDKATPIPQFAAVVYTAKLNSFRAEALLRRGRAGEAMALVKGIVDAGRMMSRSRSQLIENLVGMLLLEIAARDATRMIASGKLDGGRLREVASWLSVPSGSAAGFQEGLRYEYVSLTHVLDHLPDSFAKGATPKDRLAEAMARTGFYFYLPHRTRALFAARLRLVAESADKPCLQAGVARLEPLPYMLRPNMVGRILYDIAIPQYERVPIRRCSVDFRMTAAATAAALEAYRLDHGRYPAALAELTPGYLPSPPVDSFTGAAPLYSGGGEIHSAGKDDEGRPL